jgi:hypothetical protein
VIERYTSQPIPVHTVAGLEPRFAGAVRRERKNAPRAGGQRPGNAGNGNQRFASARNGAPANDRRVGAAACRLHRRHRVEKASEAVRP